MDALAGLVTIALLGAGAQWLASLLRLPSILVLLVAGFVAGPVTGLIDPNALFGDLLFPLVSISVALLLFEGGLSLRLSELQEHGGVVLRLVTIGALITWAGTAVAAHLLCGLSLRFAVLLGAILVVTGPTVVLPLLRQIRPTGAVGSILRWEGILIDPIGAVLAVLVFEGMAESLGAATRGAVMGIGVTLLAGGAIGIAAGWLLTLFLRRYWIPDHLHNPVALAVALAAFVAANSIQEESGLLAVTFMGVFLANQRKVSVHHITEFKENVRVIVISALFIVLAARLKLSDLEGLDPIGVAALILVLILVIRPLCVLASTARSATSRSERIFLAGMAPRGIVAAAVSSVFALRLGEEAGALQPITFLVILGTVVVYGLGSATLARRLGLAVQRPQGFLLVGAHAWAREFALTLREHEVPVLLADTNAYNVGEARMAGLSVHHGNLLVEDADERLDLRGLGRLLALTPNDEVNSLAAIHYVPLFGRREVYQLPPARDRPGKRGEVSPHLRGRHLFGEEWTYRAIAERFAGGARFKATRLSEQFDLASWRERYGPSAVQLLTIDGGGGVALATLDQPLEPAADQILVALVDEPPDEKDGLT